MQMVGSFVPLAVLLVLQFQESTSSFLLRGWSTYARTRPSRYYKKLVRHTSRTSLRTAHGPVPIDPAGWPSRFPAKEHCSKCGLCETSLVTHVVEACPFLENGMSRIDFWEEKVHGRGRDNMDLVGGSFQPAKMVDSSKADESRFGILYEPMRLVKGGLDVTGAQWTGAVTSIALAMLETGEVDAVVCIARGNSTSDGTRSWCDPEPIIARTKDDVLRGRGVKPALAPSLNVLDKIKNDPTIRRLLFCGVGCAVQAFRSVQHELKYLEKVYVLGTNCADNSPTPRAAAKFLREGVQVDEQAVEGYEFMQDYRVHVKTQGGDYVKKPYFSLPGSIAKQSIATSCLACFDYTNALADLVIGYMGAPLAKDGHMEKSFQTLSVRNERGAFMVATARKAGRVQLGSIALGQRRHEQLAVATVLSDALVQEMMGTTPPDSGMPLWMGEIMATLLQVVGPIGVSFARYSIDYHILRNYLHLVHWKGEQYARRAMPVASRAIVEKYLHDYTAFRTAASSVERMPSRRMSMDKR